MKYFAPSSSFVVLRNTQTQTQINTRLRLNQRIFKCCFSNHKNHDARGDSTLKNTRSGLQAQIQSMYKICMVTVHFRYVQLSSDSDSIHVNGCCSITTKTHVVTVHCNTYVHIS